MATEQYANAADRFKMKRRRPKSDEFRQLVSLIIAMGPINLIVSYLSTHAGKTIEKIFFFIVSLISTVIIATATKFLTLQAYESKLSEAGRLVRNIQSLANIVLFTVVPSIFIMATTVLTYTHISSLLLDSLPLFIRSYPTSTTAVRVVSMLIPILIQFLTTGYTKLASLVLIVLSGIFCYNLQTVIEQIPFAFTMESIIISPSIGQEFSLGPILGFSVLGTITMFFYYNMLSGSFNPGKMVCYALSGIAPESVYSVYPELRLGSLEAENSKINAELVQAQINYNTEMIKYNDQKKITDAAETHYEHLKNEIEDQGPETVRKESIMLKIAKDNFESKNEALLLFENEISILKNNITELENKVKNSEKELRTIYNPRNSANMISTIVITVIVMTINAATILLIPVLGGILVKKFDATSILHFISSFFMIDADEIFSTKFFIAPSFSHKTLGGRIINLIISMTTTYSSLKSIFLINSQIITAFCYLRHQDYLMDIKETEEEIAKEHPDESEISDVNGVFYMFLPFITPTFISLLCATIIWIYPSHFVGMAVAINIVVFGLTSAIIGVAAHVLPNIILGIFYNRRNTPLFKTISTIIFIMGFAWLVYYCYGYSLIFTKITSESLTFEKVNKTFSEALLNQWDLDLSTN